MFKKSITYTDYDGNERTDEFLFNLNKAELMEMNFSSTGGLENLLKRIVATEDSKQMIELFKDIILRSYGERSDDGKRFVKVVDGHKLADDFAQTAAFPELFMELATNDAAATEFVNGIIPQDLAAQIASRG